MAETFVAVRIPSAGTVLGDAVARHPGARITSVPVGQRHTQSGPVVDLLALAEGLPESAVAELLLAWSRRYGEPVHVMGDSFALRLPVPAGSLPDPTMAELLRLMASLPLAGNVGEQDWTEQWYRCRTAGEGEGIAARLRQATRGVAGASVRLGRPRQHDLDCWEVLRYAGGVDAIAAEP